MLKSSERSDPESGQWLASPYDPQNPFSRSVVRAQFIRKVYGILSVQLAITFAFCGSCMINQKVMQDYFKENIWVVYVVMIFFFVTTLVLICCRTLGRITPWNYILLLLVTLSMSFMTGFCCVWYSLSSVLIAALLTLVATLVITVISVFSPFDFTKCIHVLIVASVILLVATLVFVFFFNHLTWLDLALSIAGTIITVGYLAVHTQMIMGGRTYEISPEDYIYAALSLYLDIINLFLYILQLIGKADH